ncbi:MAG TPA: PAS domain S-box protein, partial [Halobacteria archaeon]|nr:PAS domain S-box protein [Halobacteria archaeon]
MEELSIFKNLPVPASLLTKDGIRIGVNTAFEAFFKKSQKETIGLPLEKLYAEKDRSKIRDALDRCIKDGRSSCEVSMIRGDEVIIPVIMNLSAIKDENGETEIILFTATDVSKLKEMQIYYDLVETINSIFLRLDREGKIIFINKFSEDLLGYTKDELIDQKLVGTIIPETGSSGGDLQELILDIGKNPKKYKTNINKVMRKDGERIWVSWNNTPIFNEQGEVSEILCIGNDITESRKHEEELEKAKKYAINLFRSIPLPTSLLTHEGMRVNTNLATEKLFNRSREEIIGLKTEELYSEEYLDNIKDALEKCKKTGSSRCEAVALRKDGSTFPAVLNFSTVKDADENITNILISATDITDIKKLNEFNENIIKLAPAAFCIVDKDGRWHLLNDRWNKAWGWEDIEINGKKAEDQPCVTEESLNALNKLWRYVVGEKKEANEGVVVPYKHKNGHTVYIKTWESPLSEGEGRLAIGIDITNEQKQQEELNRANEFNEMLLESIPVCVWLANNEGRCIYVNNEYTRVLGYSKKDLIGKKDEEGPYMCESGEPYMKEGTIEALKKIWEESKKGKRSSGVVPLMTKDGRIKIFRVMEIQYSDGWIDSAIDITENFIKEKKLKQAYEFNEMLLANMPVGLTVFDKIGKCAYINKEVTNQIGYTKEDLVGKTAEESPYVCKSGEPYMKEGTLDAVNHVWSDSKIGKVSSGIVPFKTKDGQIKLLRVIDIPYTDGKIGATIDVTEGFMQKQELQDVIYRIDDVLTRVSAGDLTAEIDPTKIAKAYKPIADNINSMIESVNISTEEIKERERELKQAIEEIGRALTRMSEGDLTAGIDPGKIADAYKPIAVNINVFLKSMTKMVGDIIDRMEKTVRSAEEGADAVGQMSTGMQQISSSAQQVASGS